MIRGIARARGIVVLSFGEDVTIVYIEAWRG
jgi:hypothetical protein